MSEAQSVGYRPADPPTEDEKLWKDFAETYTAWSAATQGKFGCTYAELERMWERYCLARDKYLGLSRVH